MVAKAPGGAHGRGVHGLWQVAACGCDTMTEVPISRWDVDDVPPELNMNGVANRQRYGGMLSHSEYFDNAFFNISPVEASVMDPQQRLLLENGYEALH
eukprot:scaffold36396_cov253-Isochrysis_galbana.AAC.1